MHVDNWDPDTYMWILQEVDVPYLPEEWNSLMAKYARDTSKVSGMTILGRYLSKMKLKQYKEYRFKDTDYLQELQKKKIEEAMKKSGCDRVEIDQALEKVPYADLIPPPPAPEPIQEPEIGPDYFDKINGIKEEDLALDLTDEDKLYLRLKWGKSYKAEEWV
jgi:hypothetical protein